MKKLKRITKADPPTPVAESAKKSNRTYPSLSFSVSPDLEKPINDRAAARGCRSRSEYLCNLVKEDLQKAGQGTDQISKGKLPRIVRTRL
jgi:hypothetical protein